MAVVKMIGKADNFELVFTKDGSDQWVATVPSDVDGTYVIEVRAFDEAGNESYACKMLFSIDTSKLIMRLEPLKYYGEIVPIVFNGIIENQKYTIWCGSIKESFFGNVLSVIYYGEVVKNE